MLHRFGHSLRGLLFLRRPLIRASFTVVEQLEQRINFGGVSPFAPNGTCLATALNSGGAGSGRDGSGNSGSGTGGSGYGGSGTGLGTGGGGTGYGGGGGGFGGTKLRSLFELLKSAISRESMTLIFHELTHLYHTDDGESGRDFYNAHMLEKLMHNNLNRVGWFQLPLETVIKCLSNSGDGQAAQALQALLPSNRK